jgi:NADP-dependent 3-hydroxy acid dehydrogenase YdfG
MAGKTAVVTGASSGIGEATTRLLAQQKCKVVLAAKVEPGLVRTEFPESSYPSAQEYYAQREYSPLEAEDIAEAVLYAVEQPPRVSVNEMLIHPTEQRK